MVKKLYLAVVVILMFFVLSLGFIQINSINLLSNANAESIEKTVENDLEAVVVSQPDVTKIENSEQSNLQQIAVVWKNDISQLKNVRLVYQNENGEKKEISESNRTDASLLFEEDTNNLADGAYSLDGLRYQINGSDEEKTFTFDDAEIDAEFTVSTVDESSAQSAEESLAQIEITDLNNYETTVSDGVKQTLATMSAPKMTTAAASNDPLTVVLDPGHGGNDTGACGNGLQEKNINLTIAKYCRDELEEYQGVEVYMVRETDIELSASEIITYATNVGADLLVSIHNNAGGGTGAEVYYPNQNYRSDISVEGEGVAQSIQNELVTLGLNNRGIKTRTEVKGVDADYDRCMYPDGSAGDWYFINRNAKENGYCGIIIEHAFIDSASDVSSFLNSDAKLKDLGIADATGIANYYGLTKGIPEQTIENGTYFIQSQLSSSKVMDVAGGSISSGANIQLYDSNGTGAQQFTLTYESDGYYTIINKKSGLSLDVYAAQRNSGTNLWQYTANHSDAQKWRIIKNSNGTYTIKSKLGTVIDVNGASTANGTNIWLYASNNTAAQQWKFVKSSDTQPSTSETKTDINEGIYIFHSSLNSNMVMDVQYGSLDNAANIQLYTKNSTDAQKFKVTKNSNGYYSIVNIQSGKSIDVANGSNASGANLWQYQVNHTQAQMWSFLVDNNGYYTIKSALGTVIDVSNGSATNGNNLWMYSANHTKAQKWTLEKIADTSSVTSLHSIAGTSSVTKNQLVNYFSNTMGKTYPSFYANSDAPTLDVFCQMYVEEAKAENIKVEVAFCQAMKETGWLNFGGKVKIEQYNFAGLGATDDGAAGASFSSVRIGIRAQIQHLKAYANSEALKNEIVDPRFSLVTRGSAPYVEWLGQKENPNGKGWATSQNYGYDIVNMIKNIK